MESSKENKVVKETEQEWKVKLSALQNQLEQQSQQIIKMNQEIELLKLHPEQKGCKCNLI